MKTVSLLFCSLLLSSFLSTKKIIDHASKPIAWKEMDTEEKVRAEIDKKIPLQTAYDSVTVILMKEKHEVIAVQGDSLIFFYSPVVPVHPMALVARKWILTFHFKAKLLTKYDCQKGLVGP